MSVLGLLGRLGPVRRLSDRDGLAGRYRVTCPACLNRSATVTVTAFGERIACTSCTVVDVRQALDALDRGQAA